MSDRPLSIPVRSPGHAQRNLSQDEITQLVAEYLAGDDIKIVAIRWGIHRTTVTSHLTRAGVPLRRHGLTSEQP